MSEFVLDTCDPLPSDQADGKRDKGVMVYLTDAERTAFKQWAFERDVSMSDVLATEVSRLLEAAQHDTNLPNNASQNVDDQPAFALEASDGIPHSEACTDDDETVRSRAIENRAALVALASQRHQSDIELESHFWAALTDGALLSDLVSLTGLSQEYIRQILKHAR